MTMNANVSDEANARIGVPSVDPGLQPVMGDGELGQPSDSNEGREPNVDYVSFPMLPLGVTQMSPDQSMEFTLQHGQRARDPSMMVSTLLAAWALIASGITNSERASFDVKLEGTNDTPSFSTENFQVDLPSDGKMNDLLRSVEERILEGSSVAPLGMMQPPLNNTLIVAHESDFLDKNEHQLTDQGRYALILHVGCGSDHANGVAKFDPRVIERPVVSRLLERVEFVMRQLATEEPPATRADIDPMCSNDLESIWRWNRGQPRTVSRCIHELIDEWVRTQPGAQAVSAFDGILTYRELGQLSSRLAARLSTLLSQDQVVPVLFAKSKFTPVVMLAVMKAGAAFTMLDPTMPEDRLGAIVREIGSDLLICSAIHQGLSRNLTKDVFKVDSDLLEDLLEIGKERTDAAVVTTESARMAYLAFTSGSTGTPKAVPITHENLASAIYHQSKMLRYTPDSRIFDLAPYSTSTSVHNNLFALAAGGCVCIPDDDLVEEQGGTRENHLGETLTSMRATHVTLAPSVAVKLSPEDVPRLKSLTIVGEGVTPKHLSRWQNHVRINHAYELTEATSYGTILTGADGSKPLNVGRGEGVRTWIVHPQDHDKLLPVGHIGEVLLEGPLIASGYWKDHSSLNNQTSFIESPVWMRRGTATCPGREGKLFKSGDLARYDEDGSLTLIGRKNGFTHNGQEQPRFDAAEAEFTLRNLLPEATFVITDLLMRPGDAAPTLAALLQLGNTTNDAAEQAQTMNVLQLPLEITKRLARHLPERIAPRIFYEIHDVPSTPSGRVHRQRLHDTTTQSLTQDLAPKSWTVSIREDEQSFGVDPMQQLWAEALNIDVATIRPDDNFFNLGGDSMTALRVVDEARKLGIDSSVADIFCHPTLNKAGSTRRLPPAENASYDVPPFGLLSSPLEEESVHQQCGKRLSEIQDAYPCTPLQEGLLSLSSLRPGSYVTQSVLELATGIDIERFCTAWEETVRHSPILRTRVIQESNDSFVQIVIDEGIHWTVATGLDDYLRADSDRPMDVGRPLSRYALVKDSAGRTRWFVWTLHHSLYDGWSQRLVLDQVRQVYQGQSPKPTASFGVFINYLKSRNKTQTIRYWREALENPSNAQFPALHGITDSPAPDKQLERQMAVSRPQSSIITTSTLIHAAWALLIGSMTNSQDAVFGATLSGRNAPIDGIAGLVAPTIATVPVRVRWPTKQPISSYLEDLQRQAAERIPYEQAGLQNIRRISPDARHACDFQTLIVIQPHVTDSHDDVLGTWQEEDLKKFSVYALMLEVLIGKEVGSSTVRASFDSRVIDSGLVETLLARLEHTIQQLGSAGHDQVIADISTMLPQELEQIWGPNKSVPMRVDRCVHDMFEERVKSQPDAPAIEAWDGILTYGELDQMTNVLAVFLHESGVQPGIMVPLCFEKSMWTVVSMLAVLKAGGAFVLLETALPEQRLKTIVNQFTPHLILSSTSSFSLASRLAKTVIEVNADTIRGLEGQIFPSSTHGLERPSADVPVFALFTSGSTGTPKGVVVSHANLASELTHQAERLGFTADSRVFDFASYAFDLAVLNVFGTLLQGGCLCVPSETDRRDHLAQAMRDMAVNMAGLTPSVARLLDPDAVPQLDTLLLCGEQVMLADVKRWWGRVPNIINGYGPSECTICSTIQRDVASPQDLTRIGKGVGTVTWIVDANDDNVLVPPGCVGELLLEGPLVVKGYLNDPMKTAAAFIKAPSWLTRGNEASGVPGRTSTLYKTGDLVRCTEDGSLIYVGRKDAQVKIRGQRVELGEIEFWVKDCMPEAKQVVAEVIFRKGDRAQPAVVAFIQLDGKELGSDLGYKSLPITDELEDRFLENIPAYMVPTRLIEMSSLPSNANGKLDRKRLKEIGASDLAEPTRETASDGIRSKRVKGTSRQPSLEAERTLLAIWARVLNLEQSNLGIDDSFLRLGGDSIAAMQVAAAARRASIMVHAGDVMGQRTIFNLARVRKQNRSNNDGSAGAVRQGYAQAQSTTTPSPIQNIYFQVQPNPESCFDQCWLVRPRMRISHTSLQTSLETIVRRHDALRARFKPTTTAGVWEQHFTHHVGTSFHLMSEEATTPTDLATVISQCRSRLDIENGPILSAAALNFDGKGDNDQSVFISIHHLVVDFVSWNVIFGELERLLTTGVIEEPPSMAFETWIALQAQQVSQSPPPSAAQPVDISAAAYWGMETNPNLRAGVVSLEVTVDEQTSSLILGRSNDTLRTRPHELLLSALMFSFSKVFSSRQGPQLFCEGHGREPWDDDIDVSSTVGWFTTLFPIHCPSGGAGEADPETTLVDTIRRVKDYMRSLRKNGWADFSSLAATPASAAELASRFPVEVLFNYAGQNEQLEGDQSFFEPLLFPQACDPPTSMQVARVGLFELEARVSQGKIMANLHYHRDMKHQDQIHRWAEELRSTLRLMPKVLSGMVPEWTLSDFPMAFGSYDTIRSFGTDWLCRHALTFDDIEDVFPCTPIQEGMLLAQTKNPAYYRPWFEFHISTGNAQPGLLDRAQLYEAWRALVRRHSLLRAVVSEDIPGSSSMMLVVLKDPEPVVRWGEEEKVKVDNSPGVSGVAELLHTLTVTDFTKTSATLRIEMNHVIVDGFSRDLLVRELQEAYAAQPHSVAVGEYSMFVRYFLEQPKEAGVEFWTRHLAGVEPCHLEVSRPTAPTGQGDPVGGGNGTELSTKVQHLDRARIRAFCAEWEVTPAAVVQAAWALVLGTHAGTRLPCFGSLQSGRDMPVNNASGIFGPLIAMNPLRLQLDSDASVVDVLRRLQEDYLGTLPWQFVPLVEMHRALGLDARPLFNTAMSFQRGVEYDLVQDGPLRVDVGHYNDPTEVSCSSGQEGQKRASCREALADITLV